MRGFSFAEVSLAVGVATLLAATTAAGGQVVLRQSQMKKLVSQAADIQGALDKYYSSPNKDQTTWPWPNPGNGDLGWQLWAFLPNQGPTWAPLTALNPVSGQDENVVMVTTGAGTPAASVYPASYSNAGYPLDGQGGRMDNRGKVIYFYGYSYKGPSGAYTMYIWDGNLQRNYYMWSVQATDDKGYPLATYGR